MPNPYDFVRFSSSPPKRESPVKHESFSGIVGKIRCRLTVLSSLFTAITGGGKNLSFPQKDGIPFIPGSSIKGMVRAVAEAASSSCLILSRELFGPRGELKNPYKGRLSEDLRPCRTADSLCPTCRLFGMVGSGSGEEGRETEGRPFLGKVRIGQARSQANSFQFEEKPVLITLMRPHPDHRSFYLPQGKVAGRKFYFHRPLGVVTDSAGTRFNKRVSPLAKGSQLWFEVAFYNLSEDEFSLLLYVLFLEEGMAHKLGMGKPLGFGSCRIEPEGITLTDLKQRYRELGRGKRELPEEGLIGWIQDKTAYYRQSQDQPLQDLRRILKFDPQDKTNIRYPSMEWFENHPEDPLKKTP